MEKRPDLSRFTEAHRRDYQRALQEIKNGRKTSHWMWYIFPQFRGYGNDWDNSSEYNRKYAIQSLDEATAFLQDPYLGKNLISICHALLQLETDNPLEVFDKPDDKKLQRCMSLFASISENGSVFQQVLEKYFDGKQDRRRFEELISEEDLKS